LTLDVDDRAERLQKRLPRAGLPDGSQRPSYGLEVDARADAAPVQPLAGAPEGVQDARLRREGQQGGRAGQRGAPQQGTHLVAKPAARHEGKTLRALGELVEELHRHAPAERMADDRGPLDADHREQVADARRVGAE
jgi:hypothetical protein